MKLSLSRTSLFLLSALVVSLSFNVYQAGTTASVAPAPASSAPFHDIDSNVEACPTIMALGLSDEQITLVRERAAECAESLAALDAEFDAKMAELNRTFEDPQATPQAARILAAQISALQSTRFTILVDSTLEVKGFLTDEQSRSLQQLSR